MEGHRSKAILVAVANRGGALCCPGQASWGNLPATLAPVAPPSHLLARKRQRPVRRRGHDHDLFNPPWARGSHAHS